MVDYMSLTVLITALSGACIGIISQIQHSRCLKLRVCYGMCECVRKVPDVEEPTITIGNQQIGSSAKSS